MVSKKEQSFTKRITPCKNTSNTITSISYNIKRNIIIDSIRQRAKRIITPKQHKTYTPEDAIVWKMREGRHMETYTNKSAVRSVCGAVCVVVGVVTLPFPTGSILLILLGAGLLGYDTKELYRRVKYEINLFKLRYFAKWV